MREIISLRSCLKQYNLVCLSSGDIVTFTLYLSFKGAKHKTTMAFMAREYRIFAVIFQDNCCMELVPWHSVQHTST